MKKFGGIFSCSNFNIRVYDVEIIMVLIILFEKFDFLLYDEDLVFSLFMLFYRN